MDIVRRERYNNEALVQAILRPEFGRQSLCELLTALTSTEPVKTMNSLRRARAYTPPATLSEFDDQATGKMPIHIRLPGHGDFAQRLTPIYDRLFEKETPIVVAQPPPVVATPTSGGRGNRGGRGRGGRGQAQAPKNE